MKHLKENPVIIITGASYGIGKEIALKFVSSRKCRLILAARTLENLIALSKSCKDLGSEAIPISIDVTNQQSCKKLILETINIFGQIDILVLNAGISFHTSFESLEEEDLSLYKKLLEVNFMGYLYCTYYALPYLKKTKGQIAVIGSLSGELGLPFRSGYCASKFAVKGFFESLRTEIPSNIVHITIISPGTVNSTMREHSLKSKNNHEYIQFHESPSKSMSIEECAEHIVNAIDKKKLNVTLTLYGKLAVYLKPFFPSLINYMAMKKAGGVLKQNIPPYSKL